MTVIQGQIWIFLTVPCESADSQSLEQAKNIRQKIYLFLTTYIRENALRQTILRCKKDVFVSLFSNRNYL